MLITTIYNKGLVPDLLKEDEAMVKKREDLQRVLKLLDKALRNLTSVKMSHSRKDPVDIATTSTMNPWEKNVVSSTSDIDWSVVKSKKSLIG